MAMRRIGVGVIGAGWIGEIRAQVCGGHPLVAFGPNSLCRVEASQHRHPRPSAHLAKGEPGLSRPPGTV